MNKELYLNETTKVGLVVDDDKKFKKVESNENEETIKILELQNELEKAKKYDKELEHEHLVVKRKIRCKYALLGLNIFAISAIILGVFSHFGTLDVLAKLIMIIIPSSLTTMFLQWVPKDLLGTFAGNKFYKESLIEKLNESYYKIRDLNEKFWKLKIESAYNENNIPIEDIVIKLATVNYPERTNDETLVNDIQSPAKIKKITFNHNGTTK